MDPETPERPAAFGLQELFDTIKIATGLDVSIYPPDAKQVSPLIDRLPISYRRHMSRFCRAVKNSRDGRGCGGHDSTRTNRLAAEIGHPFVQRCHAGIAEVIVPVFGGGEHLATVFIGQAVTEDVENDGFAGIWRRLQERGVDREEVRAGLAELPRLPRAELLRLGQLVDAAIKGLNMQMSAEAFALEIGLQHAPAVRLAVDILQREKCWDITEGEMAERVHLSHCHFSRLFHRVLGKTFKTYLTELRVARAQILLHHTDSPIADIAARCGFARQSYFTRRFREVTGLTPSQYRNNR